MRRMLHPEGRISEGVGGMVCGRNCTTNSPSSNAPSKLLFGLAVWARGSGCASNSHPTLSASKVISSRKSNAETTTFHYACFKNIAFY